MLDGAALSAALAAAPLGLLEQLTLPLCHLSGAVVRQLDDSLIGTACRLDLGLDFENAVVYFPLLKTQLLTLLCCCGGGWQANLHSLSLVENSVSPLSQGLSPLRPYIPQRADAEHTYHRLRCSPGAGGPDSAGHTASYGLGGGG